MSNLSDKDIDRLSREAADFYEPDHSSLSWARLEQKLVEQIPERPPDGFRFGRINPYIWGSAILMIAAVSFFAIKNIYYSQHSTQTIQPIVRNIQSSAPDDKQPNGKTIQLDRVSSAHVKDASDIKNKDLQKKTNGLAAAEERTGSADGKNSGTVNDAYVAGSANKIYQKPNIAGIKLNPGAKSRGSKNRNLSALGVTGFMASNGSEVRNAANVTTGNNKNALENSNTVNGSTISNASNNKSSPQRNRNQLSFPSIVSSGTPLGKVSGNDSLLNQLTHSRAPIQYKALRINRSLNFGLTFGPDYTDAGGISNDQLGNNIGITVGYYLTNKISVNSGILYTNKFYWAPGHGTGRTTYTRGPLQTGNVITAATPPPIDYINGSANMWELPLTLRYDFAKNEKTKFFVNAGFSSYFIMKQTYIYFFHNGMRPLAFKIEDNEQVNYWFKVANISVGLESEIGKGFSFQAEPFLKLPFKNMGIDNLKLNSYGFLLSFRYTPVLSRTKK
jgi:hypothetical protein